MLQQMQALKEEIRRLERSRLNVFLEVINIGICGISSFISILIFAANFE